MIRIAGHDVSLTLSEEAKAKIPPDKQAAVDAWLLEVERKLASHLDVPKFYLDAQIFGCAPMEINQ